MEKATAKAKLVADSKDILDYITYVFELLDIEDKERLKTKYLMCVRYPNWECPSLELGEIGYLSVLEVIAGYDKYYRDGQMIPYNYSNIQFLNFVPEKTQISKEIKLD